MRRWVPLQYFGLGWLNTDWCLRWLMHLKGNVRLSNILKLCTSKNKYCSCGELSWYNCIFFPVFHVNLFSHGFGNERKGGMHQVHECASENQLLQYLFSIWCLINTQRKPFPLGIRQCSSVALNAASFILWVCIPFHWNGSTWISVSNI